MASLLIKGYDLEIAPVKDSFSRRAQQYKNAILATLKKLGVGEDDIEVELERVAARKASASVEWNLGGHYLYYGYGAAANFAENLLVISKVLALLVDDVLSGKKSIESFINEFSEQGDVEAQRKEARALLGIEEGTTDMAIIDKKYRELAKQHHPDMPGGSQEEFKKINHAHKTLRRELT